MTSALLKFSIDHSSIVSWLLNFFASYSLQSLTVTLAITVILLFVFQVQPRRRWLGLILATEFVPPLGMTFYSTAVHWWERAFPPAIDEIALTTALVAGTAFIFVLPLPLWVRILAALGYVPLMLVYLMGFGVWFACAAFRDCL